MKDIIDLVSYAVFLIGVGLVFITALGCIVFAAWDVLFR